MLCRSIGLILLLATGCSPIRVASDFDPAANFTELKTYQWYQDPQEKTGDPLIDSTLLDKRIRTAVDATLKAHGYGKATSSEPDFWVSYHAALRHRLAVSAAATETRHEYEFGWDSETNIYDYEEGTLILDIINPEDSTLIWRGYAQAHVDLLSSREEKTEKVCDAVRLMLELFPPD